MFLNSSQVASLMSHVFNLRLVTCNLRLVSCVLVSSDLTKG